MTDAPLLLAVPSKGRLQENAMGFFARAGLPLVQSRGARDYRGAIAGVAGAEVAFLSASEIASSLGQGTVHLGITGEDLLREDMDDADARLLFLEKPGFGPANVVVAVPAAWIDVRDMADLDDVATHLRAKRGRPLRVATKYVNLTRGFFARHGIVDYRIVESAGATEGAPAAGAADIIVDITTTGATLAANALKILDDGIMLKSEANLVASLQADWSQTAREAARTILARLGAAARARAVKEVHARLPIDDGAVSVEAADRFGATAPFGAPEGGLLVLHVPNAQVYALADWLMNKGAEAVSVAALDEVFDARNPLWQRLVARLNG
ncbi:ATP phosphoribosyltransferase [Agaricicola taiwanensis]|uniref:ATP phosphoribosyltransferase n=1 Tax=Agaricicola taiwanensis TaxID=591372 RepID=A0A8J2VR64_9RHOB|nr:ATP phosphoribosyltransferase [Agaricicola taiwanensis]GGE34157.1 ATP phosphoribosyltransferase [Agaricicola taiwanensis]